jgi:chromopyrrolic acid synthase
MIHFLIVNNIIMAMGEPFHVPDVDFGTINNTLPVPLDFSLEALGVGSVQRFIAIERPEDQVGELYRPPGQAHRRPSRPRTGRITPTPRSASCTATSARACKRVPDVFMVDKGRRGGEHHLFLRESINATHPDYQLQVDLQVDDVNSANRELVVDPDGCSISGTPRTPACDVPP